MPAPTGGPPDQQGPTHDRTATMPPAGDVRRPPIPAAVAPPGEDRRRGSVPAAPAGQRRMDLSWTAARQWQGWEIAARRRVVRRPGRGAWVRFGQMPTGRPAARAGRGCGVGRGRGPTDVAEGARAFGRSDALRTNVAEAAGNGQRLGPTDAAGAVWRAPLPAAAARRHASSGAPRRPAAPAG